MALRAEERKPGETPQRIADGVCNCCSGQYNGPDNGHDNDTTTTRRHDDAACGVNNQAPDVGDMDSGRVNNDAVCGVNDRAATFESLNDLFQRHLPLLKQTLEAEFASINELNAQDEQQCNQINGVHRNDDAVGAVLKRRIEVAVDSGSVANTIGLEDLPDGLEPSGNPTGAEFRGANNSPIRRYGHVDTLCETTRGGQVRKHGTRWEASDVNRALQSVSCTTGPADHPIGLQDVLFNNRKCYVVQPGIVDAVMKHINAVMDFDRHGGLYTCEMEISDFTRPVQGR